MKHGSDDRRLPARPVIAAARSVVEDSRVQASPGGRANTEVSTPASRYPASRDHKKIFDSTRELDSWVWRFRGAGWPQLQSCENEWTKNLRLRRPFADLDADRL